MSAWLALCASCVVMGIASISACTQILTSDDLMGGTLDAGGAEPDAATDVQEEPDAAPDRDAPDAPPDAVIDAPDAGTPDVAPDVADEPVEEPAPCTADTLDCDGNAANGCETDVTSDGTHCGGCGRDCLGGACVDRRCQPVVLASGQDLPTGVALDTAGALGRVYWTNRGDSGTICSVSKSGGPITVHASNQDRPGAIVVDANRIYWVTSGLQASTGTVAAMDVTGAPDGGTVELLATDQNNPFALALTAGRLYWTNSVDNGGWVGSVDTTGSDFLQIATDQDLPTGIAGDDVGVYWANLDADEIRFWDPHDVTPHVGLFLGGLSNPGGVAVDGLNVYWTEITGSVLGATKIGKHVTTYAVGQSIPTGIAVDGLHVYWANNAGGSIVRNSKVAGAIDAGVPEPTVLAENQNGPLVIALDNTAIYWSNAGDGTIMRLAK